MDHAAHAVHDPALPFAAVPTNLSAYARQHEAAGRLGLIGAVALSASIALYAIALPVMSAVMFAWLAVSKVHAGGRDYPVAGRPLRTR